MSQIQKLIEKAGRYLRSAELLIQDADYDSAVSRAYYAMFYAAQAALLKKGMTFSSHKAVISAFGRYFVKTGIFEKEMGKDLNVIFDERQLGDYEPMFSISQDDARRATEAAQGFVAQIAAWLEKN
jgi:uncharacterized protein (UPF0332 family)